jgi:hypothetical protein
MHTLRRAFGALLLCITLTLTVFAVWLLVKGNDPEHAALAGGIFIFALVVPYGLWQAGPVCAASLNAPTQTDRAVSARVTGGRGYRKGRPIDSPVRTRTRRRSLLLL